MSAFLCADCGAPISGRGKTGSCQPCSLSRINGSPEIVAKRGAALAAHNAAQRAPRPRCACGAEITRRAERCRPCNMAEKLHTPEVKARSSKTLSMRHRSEPEFHERHRASCQAAMDACMQDPDFAETRRAAGRKSGPRNIRKTWTPEARAKAARSLSATRLAHIPAEHRDLYRDMMRKGLSAVEREALIREHVEAERERAPRLVRQAEAATRAKHERDLRDAY